VIKSPVGAVRDNECRPGELPASEKILVKETSSPRRMKSGYIFLARADTGTERNVSATLGAGPGRLVLLLGRSIMPTRRDLAILGLALAYAGPFFGLLQLSRNGILPQALEETGTPLWILWFGTLFVGEIVILEMGGKWRGVSRRERLSRRFVWTPMSAKIDLTRPGRLFQWITISAEQGEFRLRVLGRRKTLEDALGMTFGVPLIFRD